MAIRDFWRQIVGPHEPVSKEFEHMLMREVMRTELLRVKALIIVAIVIMFNISFVRVLFPGVEERIWRGINPNTIFLILSGFILFEWWVHTAISRHLKLDQDVHTLRRYIGTLIETSLPSVSQRYHSLRLKRENAPQIIRHADPSSPAPGLPPEGSG